jgi:hypothetical protein
MNRITTLFKDGSLLNEHSINSILVGLLLAMNPSAAVAVTEQDFIGIQYDLSKGMFIESVHNYFMGSATSVNNKTAHGYRHSDSWGQWVSRVTGSTYTIGIAKLPNEENPGVIFLEQTKFLRPGEAIHGIEHTTTIRAAAFVKASKKLISVEASYCHPAEKAHLSHNYDIIAALTPKHKKDAEESIYGGSGIEADVHQAWFVDVDNEELIPLTENELRQLNCYDRKW